MAYRLGNDVLLFVGLVLSIRCGGRVIDETVARGPNASGGSGPFSSTTGPGVTTGPTTVGSTTTGGDPPSSAVTSTATTTSTSTGFGGGPKTTTMSTTTATSSTTGFGGYGGSSPGTGGFGGAAQQTILCTSAPILGTDQQINCKKVVGDSAWACACGVKGTWRYCTGKGDMPCGSANCCGFDTSAATGCAATPVTLPPISGCVERIRAGYLGCAHTTQLNNPGYGPFTSCCSANVPYSCPTGTPGSCYATAEQARANCKEYCVQCVPTMF